MNDITGNVRAILESIEGSPLPERLVETPKRVQRAYEELFEGYNTDIPSLFKSFDGEGDDQLVIAKDIPFSSTCEHHLLSFGGFVSVAYLPNKRVIGASKLPRIVLAYSHRLQLQERIAEQVANVIMKFLEPKGVAVIIKGKHDCITCRGIKSDCEFVNSIMLGVFRDVPTLRAEVLSLLR